MLLLCALKNSMSLCEKFQEHGVLILKINRKMLKAIIVVWH